MNGFSYSMDTGKPLNRAQFYHEEARKLREHAASEEGEFRRKTLLEIADSYEETARQLLAEAKGKLP
jgi:hypothetical protein